MSRKRKTYTADFKAKLVLEVLKSEKILIGGNITNPSLNRQLKLLTISKTVFCCQPVVPLAQKKIF